MAWPCEGMMGWGRRIGGYKILQLDIVFVAELEKSLSLFSREFGSSSLQSLWSSRKESATFFSL